MESKHYQQDSFAAYTANYRKRHPEKVKQWRETSAVNMLRRAGYTVIEPKRNDNQQTGGHPNNDQ